MLNIINLQGNINGNHIEISLDTNQDDYNEKDNQPWQGCEEIGYLIYCSWKCKMGQPLWKTVSQFLKYYTSS